MKNSEWLWLIFCWLFGAVSMAVFITSCDETAYSRYVKAIEKCQENLPRNQKCVVVGVPENK